MSATIPPRHQEAWRGVDDGWGRRAAEFAALSEPANCREYVALHQELGLRAGERLLDVACGAGLALELAPRGVSAAGIDASSRLVAVARDRMPDADLRVGDMHAMPWPDASFDVVTSFRGIWGTTPDALSEVHRVLAPGGRLGLTVWGHIKASPGAWALAPFRLASEPRVAHQAAMVSLGRPGAGEQLLADFGFVGVRRVTVPFAWEFADPDSYARALASTGPAYEAIQSVGEEEFLARARAVAHERIREGLPLRAEIDVVGYLARKPADRPAGGSTSFLGVAPRSTGADHLYAEDREEVGYVMNASRTWAHLPEALTGLFDLLGLATAAAGLTKRQRGILVAATASTLGDTYCSLAWGGRLADAAGEDVAVGVLDGTDDGLSDAEQTLAAWARAVARDPNGTRESDVEGLRAAGHTDAEILAITVYVGLRIAFSSVNDALGMLPDRQLGDAAPERVREALPAGRPIASEDGPLA